MLFRSARKQDWVPRTVRKSFKEIQDKATEMYARTGSMPSMEEIAKELGMKLDKLQEVMGKMNLSSVLSLDMVMEETQEKQRVSSLLSLDFTKQPEEKYLENEFRQVLKDGINSLKEKEKLVISLYYVEELNMKEIAAVMEVSEPRISQIHANAIRRLKEYLQQEMDMGTERKEGAHV